MYCSRVVLVGPVLAALLLLVMLGIGGCSEKSLNRTTITIDCITNITVDPTNGVSTHHQAVYICAGDTVKWDAKPGVTFKVHFPGSCPFNPCPDITDAHPTGKVVMTAAYPTDLTLYKYTITVNGSPFDPHVVGGGHP